MRREAARNVAYVRYSGRTRYSRSLAFCDIRYYHLVLCIFRRSFGFVFAPFASLIAAPIISLFEYYGYNYRYEYNSQHEIALQHLPFASSPVLRIQHRQQALICSRQ
jgi:hypothetical protein